MVDKSTVHGKLLQFDNWSLECGFWGKEKTGVPGEKPLRARERTNGKFNPLSALTPLPPASHCTKSPEVSLKLHCCRNSLFAL